MISFTNIVCASRADTHFDIEAMAPVLWNVILKRSVLVWKDRRIGMTCLLYTTGKIIVMGKPHGVLNDVSMCYEAARRCIRRYARLLQVKFGTQLKLARIKVLTISAKYITIL